MLECPEVFTDEVIMDELLGFFGAATETTHNSMKIIITYLTKNRESLEKIRAEFNQMFEKEVQQDPSLAELSIDK